MTAMGCAFILGHVACSRDEGGGGQGEGGGPASAVDSCIAQRTAIRKDIGQHLSVTVVVRSPVFVDAGGPPLDLASVIDVRASNSGERPVWFWPTGTLLLWLRRAGERGCSCCNSMFPPRGSGVVRRPSAEASQLVLIRPGEEDIPLAPGPWFNGTEVLGECSLPGAYEVVVMVVPNCPTRVSATRGTRYYESFLGVPGTVALPWFDNRRSRVEVPAPAWENLVADSEFWGKSGDWSGGAIALGPLPLRIVARRPTARDSGGIGPRGAE
jgi:hypothetical protein